VIARPALPAVLAALTDLPAEVWTTWDAGLAMERVGAECVVCVPPIGGAT